MDKAAIIDTVIFDVDGVLIDTSQSFPQADIASTEFIVQRMVRTQDSIPVEASDIRAFRRAGGFNSDWDVTQALAALLTAQRTIWAADSRATWSLPNFAEEAAIAYSRGTGGVRWLSEYVDETCIPSDEMIHEVVDQYYWGTTLYARYFGQPHTVVPQNRGYVHEEAILADQDLLDRLGSAFISKFGMITGRVGPELESAIERFVPHFNIKSALSDKEQQTASNWRLSFVTNIVDYSMMKKPDPQALVQVATTVESRGGLYVGDTRDDLRLVQNYRSTFPDNARAMPFWAVMIAAGEDAAHYRSLGADIVIESVNELPSIVQKFQQDTGPSGSITADR